MVFSDKPFWASDVPMTDELRLLFPSDFAFRFCSKLQVLQQNHSEQPPNSLEEKNGEEKAPRHFLQPYSGVLILAR